MIKTRFLAGSLLCVIASVACQKKTTDSANAATEAAPPTVADKSPAVAAAPAAAAQSAEQRALEEKKALMAYATMEDAYINDLKGQWASSASASSEHSTSDGKPLVSTTASKATGKPDGRTWENNNREIGFDWIQFDYEKPVAATEVRMVMPTNDAVGAVSKVELQDTGGKWNEIWSGISDVKLDRRGNRTWFVRTFPKTIYKVKAVRFTFANNLYHDLKNVDAAQLVSD
jgi:type II secretory pathway pseudopilin PulG